MTVKMVSVADIIISRNTLIRDAVNLLDSTPFPGLLVVDAEGRLVGTVNDHHIRMAFLNGNSPNWPVERIMEAVVHTVPEGTGPTAAVELMRSLFLDWLPVVDPIGRPVSLHTGTRVGRRDNRVVLMAGGMGMRLRPLTEDTPKPMLLVGGRPLLETILLSFIRQGFHRFTILVGYRHEVIRNHFGDGRRWGVTIDYVEENPRLGTAGGLSLLPGPADTFPLIVMNGDLLTAVNFGQMLMFHEKMGALGTMGVRPHHYDIPYGVVSVEGPWLKEVTEKPRYDFFINTGIYALSPAALQHLESGKACDMTVLFERFMDKGGRTAVFPIREYWIDIGRIEDLRRADAEYADVFGPVSENQDFCLADPMADGMTFSKIAIPART